jgi:dTDP-4-dehydrorhamnose 3,5-epimerase-like enzyme
VKVAATSIPEVLIIEPKVFGDARGFFFKNGYGQYMLRLLKESQ